MPSSGDDPRCPECGEPIGQRATYCMHCSADLTDEGNDDELFDAGSEDAHEGIGGLFGSDQTEGSDDELFGDEQTDASDDELFGDEQTDASDDELFESGEASSADPSPGSESVDASSAAPSPESESTVPDESAGGFGGDHTIGETDTEGDELLDPDGLVDNTLTIVVGVASGFVIGFIALLVGAVLLGPLGLLLGLVVWITVTVYVSRQRTVQGALSLGGYGIAVALLSCALLPFGGGVEVDGGVSGRLTVSVIFFVVMLLPAGIAAGIGWFADRFVPEETEQSTA